MTLERMEFFLHQRLRSLSDTPRLDAQVLLAHVLDKPRTWVMAHPLTELTNAQQRALEAALTRLEGGEPLPYVLGRWEFYGLEFFVTPQVLIPRPETEHLVERALAWLRRRSGHCLIADVGCGSGCIAVSLAVNHPDLSIVAIDISWDALQVARRNAIRHAVVDKITFIQGDLLSAVAQWGGKPLDLICANLPYVPSAALSRDPTKPGPLEPLLALDGGEDGLNYIRCLLAQAVGRLAGRGLLLVEIEASQGSAVIHLAQQNFPQAQIEVMSDLAGLDRVLVVQQN